MMTTIKNNHQTHRQTCTKQNRIKLIDNASKAKMLEHYFHIVMIDLKKS